MSLSIVRSNADADAELTALGREADRLREALRDDEWGRMAWIDHEPEKLTPERREQINARLAEIDIVLKPHRDRARREEFPRAAARVGYPSRPIADAMAANLDTGGPYYRELRSVLEERAARERTINVVMLAGNVGTGKSTATAWYGLQSHMDGGHPPQFITAAQFFRTSRYDDERTNILKAQELVLDDLGAEYLDGKGNALVDFDELVSVFYAERRLLIVTTNIRYVTPEQKAKHKGPATEETFQDRYGARATDRLRQCGRWVLDTSPSKRKAQP